MQTFLFKIGQFVKSAKSLLRLLGIYPYQFYVSVRYLPSFIWDYLKFKKASNNIDSPFPVTCFNPCLEDKYSDSGITSWDYFYMDLFIANLIHKNMPQKHVDVGSRVDGFVAHVASFRTIEVLDIRHSKANVENIHFIQQDVNSASFNFVDYCDSASSLHALEHFGLGRYGDRIDPQGHIKGFNNIHKMLVRGGVFYFAVPIGTQRVEYNAHRVFSISYIMSMIQGIYVVKSFSYIDDNGDFHKYIDMSDKEIISNYSCQLGCGIFELTKV